MNKKNYNTVSRFLKPVIAVSIVLFYINAAAQPLQFNARKITTESGLYTSDIRHLLKDRNGFIWVATSNKIQRYDGKYTKDFFIRDGNTYYRGLAEDRNGKIWVATDNNLYTYQNDYAGFVKYKDTARIMGDYLTLITGPSKTIYILCRKGLLYIDEKSVTLKSLYVKGFRMPNTSYFPFVSLKNYLFWSTRSMIYRYNIDTKNFDSVAAKMTRNIEIINEDSLWAGNTHLTSSLICFSRKTNQPVIAQQFSKKFITSDFYIAGVFRVSPRYLFVPVRYKGFFLYDLAANRFKEVDVFEGGQKIQFDEAPKTGIYSYGISENWLNLTAGLYYIIPENKGFGYFTISHAENEIINEGSNSIRNYAEDKEGNLWMATGNGLVRWNRINNKTKIFLPQSGRKDYLNFASVRGLVANQDKLIVAESMGGVFVFDPKKETFTELSFPPGGYGDTVKRWLFGDFISGIFTLKNGDFIAAGIQRNFYIHKKDNRVNPISFSGKEKITYSRIVFEDKQRRFWFLGGPGITVTDSNFRILHRINDSRLNGIYTNSITQVTDSSFWVAWEGLHEVLFSKSDKPLFKPIFTDISPQVFFNIFKDSLGKCWASGEKGIYKLYPDKKSYQLFDQSENVLNFQYSSAQAFRSRDGNVFFPGFSGVTYFTPEKFIDIQEPLHTIITSAKINDNDSLFFLNKAGQLKYNQNSIEINYIAPHIYNGSKVIYRYLLEGVDKDWVNTGNNTFVRFSSLSQGNYTFRVAATLNSKDWFEADTAFVFEIAPPFWKTWWFRLLCTLALTGLVIGLLQRRIKVIKSKAALKQQMTELEVKALRAQMNPHFIFNAMNSIQQFTLRNDTDNANLYISKFSTLLRKVLHTSQQPVITLEEEIEQLNLYLAIEKLRVGQEFSYQLVVDDEIEPDALKLPGLLIQPFIENALKHGLALKEGAKKLSVAFALSGEQTLIVTITDNGIGRERAAEIKKQQQRLLPYESKGIQLVEERLKLLQQRGGSLTTIDLYNNNGLPAGTRVTVIIPFRNEA